jgi:hydroxyacylglutathione hydrolase
MTQNSPTIKQDSIATASSAIAVQRFETPGLAQFAYLISAGGEAVVIDPMRDIDLYLDYARAHSLRITHVLETHIHADYASGALALAAATGARLSLSAYDQVQRFTVTFPHHPLYHGASISTPAFRLQAIHTPGHTPEHLAFLLIDSDQIPTALFTGDFLFVGSLGRPDLLGEDAKLQLAQQLYRSTCDAFTHLPDRLPVYPGHGAGSLCGSGMSDQAETTLGYERTYNPFFRLAHQGLEAEFIQTILASVPPMPTYYPRMKALNSAGATPVPPIPGASLLTPAEVFGLDPVQLLDIRAAAAFSAAHIPGSIHMAEGPSLPTWAGWLLDPEIPIILIAESSDTESARRQLARVGLDNILGSLAGGFPAWLAAKLPTTTLTSLTPSQLNAATPKPVILDVRNPSEFAHGSIPGAVNIPLGDLPNRLTELPPNQPIVTVCATGFRSSVAASLLQRAKIPAASLTNGIAAWNAES